MITGFLTACFGYKLTPNVKKKKIKRGKKFLCVEVEVVSNGKNNGIREIEKIKSDLIEQDSKRLDLSLI